MTANANCCTTSMTLLTAGLTAREPNELGQSPFSRWPRRVRSTSDSERLRHRSELTLMAIAGIAALRI